MCVACKIKAYDGFWIYLQQQIKAILQLNLSTCKFIHSNVL